MKRIVNIAVALLLIAAMSFSLVSCDDELVGRTENELVYYLPQSFTERSYPNIQVCYSDSSADFILTIWGRQELIENEYWGLFEDFDLVEFTERFIYLNAYRQEVDYVYDEERNVTTLYTYDIAYEGSEELYLFYNLLAVTESYAYIVTFQCPENVAGDYFDSIEEWISLIEVK